MRIQNRAGCQGSLELEVLGFPWCPKRVPSRRYRWGRGIQSILGQLIGYLFVYPCFLTQCAFGTE